MDHYEKKRIGIYSTYEKAKSAIAQLQNKPGFNNSTDGFFIKTILKVFIYKYADQTFWIEGFDTYTF